MAGNDHKPARRSLGGCGPAAYLWLLVLTILIIAIASHHWK